MSRLRSRSRTPHSRDPWAVSDSETDNIVHDIAEFAGQLGSVAWAPVDSGTEDETVRIVPPQAHAEQPAVQPELPAEQLALLPLGGGVDSPAITDDDVVRAAVEFVRPGCSVAVQLIQRSLARESAVVSTDWCQLFDSCIGSQPRGLMGVAAENKLLQVSRRQHDRDIFALASAVHVTNRRWIGSFPN
jgi:hypothetical protein